MSARPQSSDNRAMSSPQAPGRRRSLRTLRLLAPIAALTLAGCAVVSVGVAAVSVTAAVVSTGVTVTGKVIGAGIDAVTGDDEASTKPD